MKKLIYLLPVFLFTACSSENTTLTETTPSVAENIITLSEAQLQNAQLTIAKPQMVEMKGTASFKGQLEVPTGQKSAITFPMSGQIESTSINPGKMVQKGDVLAVIQDPAFIQLQQDYLIAKQQLVLKQKDFDRQSELNASKASSDKVFQQAQADYENQKVSVRALAEQLSLIGINPSQLSDSNLSRQISVRANQSGMVSVVNVFPGKYVHQGEILFEILSTSQLVAKLSVFEQDLANLSIGMPVHLHSNSNMDEQISATITTINSAIGADHSAQVYCSISSLPKGWAPGAFVTGDVEISTTSAIVLPSAALVTFENKNFIFVESTKGTFEIKEVQLGMSSGDQQEIKNGIELLEKNIVVSNAYTLLMAMKNKEEE